MSGKRRQKKNGASFQEEEEPKIKKLRLNADDSIETVEEVRNSLKKTESEAKAKATNVENNFPFSHVQGKKQLFNWESKSASYLVQTEFIESSIARNIMKLFDEGNTIPFVARYRKDQVGNLGPDKLRKIKDSYEYIQKVNTKASQLVKQISKVQGVSPPLVRSIEGATSLEELDFLAAPFKRVSKGSLAFRAKALHLDEVAHMILEGTEVVNLEAYVKTGIAGMENVEKVKEGVRHSIADVISKNPEIQLLLQKIINSGKAVLTSKKKKVKKGEKISALSKYDVYENFTHQVKTVKPYQVLAIFRGQAEKKLSVKITLPDKEWTHLKAYCQKKWAETVGPFVTRRVKAKLSKEAEEEAINVFGSNLRQLLLTPPCKGMVIMGVDPGFQHGCKVAVVSRQGVPLASTKLYLPTKDKGNDQSIEKFLAKIKDLLLKFQCETIALGDGKGCRQVETCLTKLIEKKVCAPLNVSYSIVSEQGVSIYSCSPVASEEFPNMDPVYISAISLARRLQDPLSELVKVEPKHLGVGLYQHDVKSALLSSALDEIVSECVSFVGVDLNTASYYLLKRIAGLGAAKAKEIIKYRQENGAFRTIDDIKKVKGINEKTFLQCAGFLRILPSASCCQDNQVNPLDRTPIHPESYGTAIAFVKQLGLHLNDLGTDHFMRSVQQNLDPSKFDQLARQLGGSVSEIALIADTFSKPLDHDIRTVMSGPLFRKEVINVDDLKLGQTLTGIVRNVVPFGAFVDIGVGINGLIHTSKINNQCVLLNDKLIVEISSLQLERKRIGLTLIKKIL